MNGFENLSVISVTTACAFGPSRAAICTGWSGTQPLEESLSPPVLCELLQAPKLLSLQRLALRVFCLPYGAVDSFNTYRSLVACDSAWATEVELICEYLHIPTEGKCELAKGLTHSPSSTSGLPVLVTWPQPSPERQLTAKVSSPGAKERGADSVFKLFHCKSKSQRDRLLGLTDVPVI